MNGNLRVIVVGLGIQGRKRLAVAGTDAVATVDPAVDSADYVDVEHVPTDRYDAALVCTPDRAKADVLGYLLDQGKHVLVEKPLPLHGGLIRELDALAKARGVACYTAYNHRFEPHIAALRRVLDEGAIGLVHYARFFYGNGTALDVQRSAWRDQGLGVLADLGSHLIDMAHFLFGPADAPYQLWSFDRYENRSCDHALFGSRGSLGLQFQVTLLSWRNTFSIDVFGDSGSAHVNCLCKWGPSSLTVRKRVFPSGKPTETVHVVESPDPTWELEYEHFQRLCRTGGTNLENDFQIGEALEQLARAAGQGVTA
ncbi:MAG: Gfo/Idh/MocA family oxidoreductase [Isosphaeraceae bacterium]